MKKLLNKKEALNLILVGFILIFCLLIRLNPAVPFFLFILYLCFHKKFVRIKSASLTNLSFLFLVSFCLGYLFLKQGFSFYSIPISIIPILAVLLFNSTEIGFFLALATSVTLATLTLEPFKAWFIFMASSTGGILLASGARKRTKVIQAGAAAGLFQLTALVLIENFQIFFGQRYLIILLNGLLSGIISLGVLPLFEYLLQTVTNISLLELADLNHPVLQRLILEAPGTYHHSLIVGNLSDTACAAIGANGLLARIGAYYHDIGKLHKPEYFIENQDINKNRHDDLSPTMSKLVIMNHIKEGIEMAKKYSLSPALWGFIQQHHGNSLVYYFYRRALEGKEADEEITEEGYRYPGPKPDTRETAVVLLADSVEAATRSLKNPSPDKIEETVHKVINNKFIDGQLDACELTLKDIEKISGVFIKILSGIYHSRISYS